MALYLDQQRVAVGGDLLAQRIGIHTIAHRDASNPQLMLSGVSTSLRRFFALSAAIALNIRLRVCLTVATPFDRMACKVKSWLSHFIAQIPTCFGNSFVHECSGEGSVSLWLKH